MQSLILLITCSIVIFLQRRVIDQQDELITKHESQIKFQQEILEEYQFYEKLRERMINQYKKDFYDRKRK